MAEIVRVEGLAELQRASARYLKDLNKELKVSLRNAAEPVRADAETLAVAEIRHIGTPWSRMRVGVTRTLVYVAPRERGRGTAANRKRPNLAPLLMGKAMEPALRGNEGQVVEAVDLMLQTIGQRWAI